MPVKVAHHHTSFIGISVKLKCELRSIGSHWLSIFPWSTLKTDGWFSLLQSPRPLLLLQLVVVHNYSCTRLSVKPTLQSKSTTSTLPAFSLTFIVFGSLHCTCLSKRSSSRSRTSRAFLCLLPKHLGDDKALRRSKVCNHEATFIFVFSFFWHSKLFLLHPSQQPNATTTI